MTVTPAAEFRDWLDLEGLNRTSNETGEAIERYVYQDRVRAAIKSLNSREVVRARAAEVQTTHTIRIRYRTDIRTTWRVRWNDPRGEGAASDTVSAPCRVAKILSITEPVRRRELELSVVEVTGE